MFNDIIFDCIIGVLNGTTGKIELEKDDYKKLLIIFKDQSLLSYLYLYTKDSKLENFYLSQIVVDERFIKLEDELDKLLNENQIKYFYLKGTVLKNLYPKTFLRSRGDLDIVIDKSDFKKAIKVISDKFIKTDHESIHHLEFKYSNLIFEVHNGIILENKKASKYFSDYNNHLILDEKFNYKYHLDDNFHFLYVINHFAGHIKEGGAGIRPLIDIWLMQKKLNIDINKVKGELKKLNLDKFYNVCMLAIDKYFNKINISEDINYFIDFLINSGIHGKSVNNNKEANLLMKKKSKFRYLLYRLFPPYSYMKTHYPFTKFILLLPLGYFFRLIKGIFRKDEIIDTLKNKDDIKINVYEKIGL